MMKTRFGVAVNYALWLSLWPGGHFRLALFRDGRATLCNDDGSRLGDAGRHVGTINVFDYARIYQLIFEGGLENLPPRYAVTFSDSVR